MSIINKNPQSIINENLGKQEIEFLLKLIKDITFKGEDIELLYNLILKLQNQYTKLL